MPKTLFDWPKKIAAHPTAKFTWELTYADDTVDTQVVLAVRDRSGGPLDTEDGQALIRKVETAGLQMWWVTRSLKWYADALSGQRLYRRRGTAPAARKVVQEIRAIRKKLDAARDEIERHPFLNLRLGGLTQSIREGIADLASDEARIAVASKQSLGRFLRELKRRCGLTVEDLVLLLRGHGDQLEKLRRPRRGHSGDIAHWVRSLISTR